MDGSGDLTDWPRGRRDPAADAAADEESRLRRSVWRLTVVEFRLGRTAVLVVSALAVVLGAGVLFGPRARVVAAGFVVAVVGAPLAFVVNTVAGFLVGWVVGRWVVSDAVTAVGSPGPVGSLSELLLVLLCAFAGAYLVNRLLVFLFALPFGLAAVSLWDAFLRAVGFPVFPSPMPTLGGDPLGFLVWFPLVFLQVLLGVGGGFFVFLAGVTAGGTVYMFGLVAITALVGANIALDPTYLAEVGATLGRLDVWTLLALDDFLAVFGRLFRLGGPATLALSVVGLLCQFALWPLLVRDDTDWLGATG